MLLSEHLHSNIFIYLPKLSNYYIWLAQIYILIYLYTYFKHFAKVKMNEINLHSNIFIYLHLDVNVLASAFNNLHSNIFIYLRVPKRRAYSHCENLHSNIFIYLLYNFVE